MKKTKEDLEGMRERMLAKTSLPEGVLKEWGESGQLHPEDRKVYNAIEAIDYLLEKD
jgi:hypothetical protein